MFKMKKNYTTIDCTILDVVIVEVPHDKKKKNCAICCNVSFVV